MKIALSMIVLVFGWWVSAESNNSVWDRIYPEVRHRNFNYPEKLDKELLELLYKIVREVGGRLHIHSDFRPVNGGTGNKKGRVLHKVINSKHAFGIAVDFRLDNYDHLSKEERLYVYYRRTEMMEELFRKYNVFDKVGFGIYPYSKNPFWHIDVRGQKARWCRGRRGNYLGYENCKDKMDVKTAPVRSTLRILQEPLWEFDKDSEIQF